MKSTSLTLDENRKKFKSGRFAQTLCIDENYKRLNETHNKPEKIILGFSRTPHELTTF